MSKGRLNYRTVPVFTIAILALALVFIFFGTNIIISFNLVVIGILLLIIGILALAGPAMARGRGGKR